VTDNYLKYKDYLGSVDVSVADSCLHGKLQFIDDLITYEGQTLAELEQAFREAVDDYLAYCDETGQPACKTYKGTFNVRVAPELHKAAVHSATLAGVTLNEFVGLALSHAVDNGVNIVEHRHHHDHNHNHTVIVTTNQEISKPQWTTASSVVESRHAH